MMEGISKINRVILDRVALVLCLIIVMWLAFGCSMLDFDGNGRIDPIAYLESADISVTWTDADGQLYTMAVDELGMVILGEFVHAKTGIRFTVSDAGGITITDPAGQSITITPKAQEVPE